VVEKKEGRLAASPSSAEASSGKSEAARLTVAESSWRGKGEIILIKGRLFIGGRREKEDPEESAERGGSLPSSDQNPFLSPQVNC